jgi:hypothetical protein
MNAGRVAVPAAALRRMRMTRAAYSRQVSGTSVTLPAAAVT